MTSAKSTWDGLPVAPEPPFGATILVYRRSPSRLLMLHRAHHGPDFDGDWAWTPPAGSRLPGEDIAACAARELHEEAGISAVGMVPVDLVPIDLGADRWKHYGVELPATVEVRLVDPEHDRFEWLPVGVALARVTPDWVRADLAALCQRLDL